MDQDGKKDGKSQDFRLIRGHKNKGQSLLSTVRNVFSGPIVRAVALTTVVATVNQYQ